MKIVFCFLILLCLATAHATPVCAQSTNLAHRKPDLSTISETGDPALDLAIKELYEVISGPAGQKRDWEKFKAMFAPGAQMGITFTNKEGTAAYKRISPEEYISSSGKFIEERGFFEKEINRKTERYGNLVHAWSTYEARHSQADAKPVMRGINSIQLVKMGNQYKVTSLIWQQESENFPLPAYYLPAAGKQ